jgi:chitinase
MLSGVDLSPPTAWRTDGAWAAGYQAEVSVTNRQPHWVEDYTFSFELRDRITSLWGGTIVSHVGDRYTVKPSGWANRLESGAKASFGFVAEGTAGPVLASVVNPELRWNRDPDGGAVTPPPPSASSVRVDYRVTSDWGSGFNGEIKITNTGTSSINGWQLKFDTSNTIASLWNGTIVGATSGAVTVKDLGWNATIAPGASVTLGFTANGASAALPSNYVFNGSPVGGGPVTPPAPVVPAISSTAMSLTEGQSGTKAMNFTVRLSAPTTTTVSLVYATADITAAAGSDYDAVSGTISFAPGETSKTVAVAIRGDTVVEADESYSLNFTNPVNGTLVSTFVTGTITNDDTAPAPEPPQITLSPVSVTEGNSGTTPMVFTIALSAASTSTITVNYATGGGTATAGTDYQAASGVLSFAPGVTSRTVTVNVLGDTTDEPNETLDLTLSGAANATIGVAKATGVIVDDDPAAPPPPSASGKQVVGYFAEWGIYDRQYDVMDIPADKLTVVNYAFAKINAAGEIDLFDSYAAIEKSYPGDTWDQPVKGNFNQIRKLKEANPHLKVVISVGGWTLSSEFSDVALTADSREKFAASAVRFVNQYGFDGIDLDWEYPVSGGLETNETRPADKQNYTYLVQALRTAFDQSEQTTGKDYLITMAVPPGYSTAQNFELDKLANVLDWMNVMAYDYHGAWDNRTGHNAPLYANPASPFAEESKLNVDFMMQYYASAGVPKSKIVMGAPVYGRSWKGVAPGPNGDGLYQTAAGAGSGTWEPGSIDYSDLLGKVNSQPATSKLYRDSASGVPYVYAPTVEGGWFSTFEDKVSLGQKIDYILANDYGGMMFWEMSADVRDSNSQDSLIGLAGSRLISGATAQASVTAADVSVNEGNSGTVSAAVVLTLSKASSDPVTVRYSTAPGTASADVDFVSSAGTVTFAPGETSKTVTLGVKGDATYEADEAFQLRIDEVTGAVRARSAVTVTIKNDDAPPATTDTATLKLSGTWFPGFGGEMTVKNTTGASISNGWVLEFDSNFDITSIWNAEIVSRVGNRYRIRNLSWNGSLAANATMTFGFNGRMSGSSTTPAISSATIRPA